MIRAVAVFLVIGFVALASATPVIAGAETGSRTHERQYVGEGTIAVQNRLPNGCHEDALVAVGEACFPVFPGDSVVAFRIEDTGFRRVVAEVQFLYGHPPLTWFYNEIGPDGRSLRHFICTEGSVAIPKDVHLTYVHVRVGALSQTDYRCPEGVDGVPNGILGLGSAGTVTATFL